MTQKPEQFVGEGVPDQNGQPVRLHIDPPIAGSHWILVRGRVELPRAPRGGPWSWLLRRQTKGRPDLEGAKLEVRLPDEEEPRELSVGPDGSFEARFVLKLPRMRSARRRVVLALRYRGMRIEQTAPLFMPQPGAALAVVVLVPHSSVAPVAGRQTVSSCLWSNRLSECSRELLAILQGRDRGFEANPIFYLQSSVDGQATSDARPPTGWPEGLCITARAKAASAVAVDHAQWIGRLAELLTDELEVVVVADTDLHSIATLRAMSRLGISPQRFRAVFLSDTRPVARGAMRQDARPRGLDGLRLPVVVCRTLDEVRRAAATCGLTAPAEPTAPPAHRAARRLTATHARVTRYPLVFCHGMLGYSVLRMRRVDLDNYFNGVRELLTDRGFHVLMPHLGKTHSIEQRADQLRQTIGRWTSEPVNIIAHSMGGLDARFLISKLEMADRVASLTTVATPHHGSYFADWFIERFDANLPLLRGLERLGIEVDGFRDCTRAACQAFNESVPNASRVRYFSYSAFQVARKVPPVLRRSHSLIARCEGANDGLVSEHSAHWGQHVATLRADHLALVGERGPENFDHLSFYTRIVDDLIRHGF